MTVRMVTTAAGSGPSTATKIGASTNASFTVTGSVYSAARSEVRLKCRMPAIDDVRNARFTVNLNRS